MSAVPNIRTTIAGVLKNNSSMSVQGLYVIACYPAFGCLYVGKSNNVYRRMVEHLVAQDELGEFLRSFYFMSVNWRVDVFCIDDPSERHKYEDRLIKYFHPRYNLSGNDRSVNFEAL